MISRYLIPLLLPACVSRAPTTYELDKRSGLLEAPPISKSTESLRKVWVYDRKIPGGYLQGTWMWMDVSKGDLNVSQKPR